ncbi:MAG: hypothetical protein JWM25_474 [Thermoleophilia bacterium]|nr:hypothetical protein [Thermoleophilia bacterium]MCZ4495891.1 hypothetical protein [Thermoleophilia bacterium]
MTEFAICLPVLLMLVIAIAQYGQMIFTSMELTSATRDGARRAAVARTEDDPAGAVRTVLRGSLDTVDAEQVDIAISGTWATDSRMTVTSTMPYRLEVIGMPVWTGTLRSQAVVRIG